MKSLNIALLGYGRMGRMIEQIALGRGHRVVLRIDEPTETLTETLARAGVDVAIEFSVPTAAYTLCRTCIELGIPVVSGTTAWGTGVEELRQLCRDNQGKTFLWSSNYSIGVNLFFEINKRVAALMQTAPSYRASLLETHHIHKLDAPSGTAITLAEGLLESNPTYTEWTSIEESSSVSISEGVLPVFSHREGEVPGTHTVCYRSDVDEIRLTHEAFGRDGFALGAVVAAEYASEHVGALTMADVLGQMLSSER